MSTRMIWRQATFALLIFCLIALVYQLETPWTRKFEGYIALAMERDSSWNLSLNDFDLQKLQLPHLDMGVDVVHLKDQLLEPIERRVNQISVFLHQQVDLLLKKLRGGTDAGM